MSFSDHRCNSRAPDHDHENDHDRVSDTDHVLDHVLDLDIRLDRDIDLDLDLDQDLDFGLSPFRIIAPSNKKGRAAECDPARTGYLVCEGSPPGWRTTSQTMLRLTRICPSPPTISISDFETFWSPAEVASEYLPSLPT